MVTSVQVGKQRANLIAKQRAILNRAAAENRDENTEEKSEYENLEAEISALEDRIAKLESLESREDDLGKSNDEKENRDEVDGEDENRDDDEDRKRNRRSAWSRPEPVQSRAASKEYRKAYSQYLKTASMPAEFRDVTVTGGDGGQYLVTPVQLSKDVVIALNNLCFVRQLANVEQVNQAVSLGCPRIATDVSDSDWTTEVGALTPDSSFGPDRRDLTPRLLSKAILISMQELAVSNNVEKIVMDRLAYKHAVAQEKAFLRGNGTSTGPLGVFTASSSGISTARDVTASSTTAFNADDLLNVVYGIPSQYQQSKAFGWIMHRDAVKMARKLKSAVGDYLLQPGISQDRGDTLCGYKLYQSEYAPNTFTSGLYVGILGDFNFYKIAELNGEYGGYNVQVLKERYADTNQIGYIQRQWLDAMPVLENAFARLKLA
jgi:HK97 family phage major capsid protein